MNSYLHKHATKLSLPFLLMLTVLASAILPFDASANNGDDPCPATLVATADTTPSATLVASSTSSEVLINEVLPNPVGRDTDGEFIELFNDGGTAIDLAGWTLVSGTGKTATIKDVVIPPREVIALPYSATRLSLTNSGMSLALHNGSGAFVSDVTYGSDVAEGSSYARTSSGTWQWTESPTPGAINTFASVGSEENSTSTSSETNTSDESSAEDSSTAQTDTSTSSESPAVQQTCTCTESSSTSQDSDSVVESMGTVSMHDLSSLENETKVTVVGNVSLPLGHVGKTIFAVQSDDGAVGTYVRIFGSERPDLATGDRVQLSGKIMRTSEELRIHVSKGGIEFMERTGSLNFLRRDVTELTTNQAGSGVTLTGTIMTVAKKSLTLTDSNATAEVRITLPEDANTESFSSDEEITVRGILRMKNNKAEIVVTDMDDVTSAVTATTASVSDEAPLVLGTTSGIGGGGLSKGLFGIIPLAALFGYIGWKKRHTLASVLANG